MKSCNVKETVRTTRTVKKSTTIGLISQKNSFARAARYFVYFLAVVLHDYNVFLAKRFTAEKHGVLEMQNFISVDMKGVDETSIPVRRDDSVRTNISWMHR